MIIDFNKIDVSVLPNFKGGEKEFAYIALRAILIVYRILLKMSICCSMP
jgi:hypothetical protein